jgi:S1-C subfamily serine protease
LRFLILVLAAAAIIPRCASAADIESAVVKIYTTVADPYYYIPWITGAPYEISGSGCIIDDGLILTNAHVVSNVTYLQVRKEGDPKKYTARVVAVSHEADLALITVDDPGFFEDITPLRLGELPRAREEVTVYGYPEGGDALSTTQGVVSRIETREYAHSHLSLLAMQIDAAINPGNSGGPAIVNDRIAGVAMQTLTQSENMGYVIPVPVIRHFLDDLADGGYDGFPSGGFSYQVIANSAITEKYGLPEEQTGVLVTGIAYGSPAAGALETGDVILEIDGYAVAGDGTIELLPGVRTSLDYLITSRQLGESVPMTVMRSGAPLDLEILLDETFEDLCIVPQSIYDREPQYYLFGGLVFMPLTRNYMESAWGSEWYNTAIPYLTAAFYTNWRTEEDTRLALLTLILPAEVNSGYQTMYDEIVTEVDGLPVTSFLQLVELLETSDGEFTEIRTNLGNLIVIDRELAAASENEIMQRYGIPADRQLD